MTLSWDPDDERVVIEVFPFTEAAVVTPDQVDEDFEEPEPDEVLPGPASPPAPPGRSSSAPSRCSRPAGRAARSAATRSTPRATCACGPTASGAGTRDPSRAPVTARGRRWCCTAGSCRPRTPRSSARSTATQVVYKPIAGERPLWDFPDGTLADREVRGVRRLRGARLGRRAADLAARRPARRRAWCSSGRSPTPTQEAVDLVARGRVPDAAGWHVFDGVDEHDRDVSLVHEDTARAAPDGGLRRRWSTTPTARAATCWRWPAATATASTTA